MKFEIRNPDYPSKQFLKGLIEEIDTFIPNNADIPPKQLDRIWDACIALLPKHTALKLAIKDLQYDLGNAFFADYGIPLINQQYATVIKLSEQLIKAMQSLKQYQPIQAQVNMRMKILAGKDLKNHWVADIKYLQDKIQWNCDIKEALSTPAFS